MSRKGIMLCQPFTYKRLEKWLSSYKSVYVQRKYNGVRARWTGRRLLSSQGNEIVSVPHIKEALLRNFEGRGLDGELYHHGLSLQEIRGITSRTQNQHSLFEIIEYHIFDIPAPAPQEQRLFLLSRSSLNPPLKIAPAICCNSEDEIRDFLEEAIKEEYEGIVIRTPQNLYLPMNWNEDAKRSLEMMKWKPLRSDSYIITDVFEGQGKYLGTLGALEVTDPEGNNFHVGSFAIPDEQRKILWERHKDQGLVGLKAKIRYYELTLGSKPPSSTFECIVE